MIKCWRSRLLLDRAQTSPRKPARPGRVRCRSCRTGRVARLIEAGHQFGENQRRGGRQMRTPRIPVSRVSGSTDSSCRRKRRGPDRGGRQRRVVTVRADAVQIDLGRDHPRSPQRLPPTPADGRVGSAIRALGGPRQRGTSSCSDVDGQLAVRLPRVASPKCRRVLSLTPGHSHHAELAPLRPLARPTRSQRHVQ